MATFVVENLDRKDNIIILTDIWIAVNYLSYYVIFHKSMGITVIHLVTYILKMGIVYSLIKRKYIGKNINSTTM